MGSPWTKRKQNIKGFLFLGSMSCNNETSDWQDYEGIHTSLWISCFNPLCLKFHFFWTTNTKFCQYHECLVLINHVPVIMSRYKWFYLLKKLGRPEKNLYKGPFIYYIRKISRKTNISYPLIHSRNAHIRVRIYYVSGGKKLEYCNKGWKILL